MCALSVCLFTAAVQDAVQKRLRFEAEWDVHFGGFSAYAQQITLSKELR